MRSDVHTSALRAAAKVAFSVAFVGGCSGTGLEAGTGDPANGYADGNEGGNESDLRAKKKPKVAAPAGTSCHEDASAPKPNCEALVNAAFPVAGQYPGTKQPVSSEVQTCCVAVLTEDPPPAASTAAAAVHRWDCCANVAPEAAGAVAMACTPWGPPVPPAMKRRAKRARPIEDWASLTAVA